MQGKIDALRAKLKSMSKADKESNKERIYSEIDSLREENSKERERLQEQFSTDTKNLRGVHKEEKSKLKDYYDEKYMQELDNLRSSSEFTKTSKRKKRKEVTTNE